jgi:hypothetical protein
VPIRLTGGPCHGQEFTITRRLWDEGTVRVMGEAEEPWASEMDLPYRPLPPGYAYRRTLMGNRPTGSTKTRYWYEWHYENPNRK